MATPLPIPLINLRAVSPDSIAQAFAYARAHWRIDEDLRMGVEGGVATTGIAVAQLGLGELPMAEDAIAHWWETDADQANSEQKITGIKRRSKRTKSRRHNRLHQLRQCFVIHGLPLPAHGLILSPERRSQLKAYGLQANLFGLRALALRVKLEPMEIAAILYTLGKRRGYRSSAKADIIAAMNMEKLLKSDDKQAKERGEAQAARQHLSDAVRDGDYQTIGEFLGQCNSEFCQKNLRNRRGSYLYLADRMELIKEIRQIGTAQGLADALVADVCRIVEAQTAVRVLPAADCKLIAGQKRCHIAHPAFEKFRWLQSLLNLRIEDGAGQRSGLAPRHAADNPAGTDQARLAAMYRRAADAFDTLPTAEIAYADLRRILGLNADEYFVDLLPAATAELRKKAEAQARKGGGKRAKPAREKLLAEMATLEKKRIFARLPGTQALRLASAGFDLDQDDLDRVAELMLGQEDLGRLQENIRLARLPRDLKEHLRSKPVMDAFALTAGRCHFSVQALRRLIPLLDAGAITVRQAVLEADFPPLEQSGLAELRNHTVRASAMQTLAAVLNYINGRLKRIPGRIALEVGRDLLAAEEDRHKHHADSKAREGRHNTAIKQLKEGGVSLTDITLKLDLLYEQGCICPYTDQTINLNDLAEVEIEHIVHRSLLPDSSRANLVLAYRVANRDKGAMTARDWFASQGADALHAYEKRIAAMPSLPFNKRKRLLMSAEEVGSMKPRLAHANSWAAKVIRYELARGLYGTEVADDGPRVDVNDKVRVNAIPGRLTARLRQALDVESLKYKLGEDGKPMRHTKTGERIRTAGETNHAVDAVVLCLAAHAPAALLQRLTRLEQDFGRDGGFDYQRKDQLVQLKGVVAKVMSEHLQVGDGWLDAFRDQSHAIARKIKTLRHYKIRPLDGPATKETHYAVRDGRWLPWPDAAQCLEGKGRLLKDGHVTYVSVLDAEKVGLTLKDRVDFDWRANPARFLETHYDLMRYLDRVIHAKLTGSADDITVPTSLETLRNLLGKDGLLRKGLPLIEPVRRDRAPYADDSEGRYLISFGTFPLQGDRGFADKITKSSSLEKAEIYIMKELAMMRDLWRNRHLFDLLRGWALSHARAHFARKNTLKADASTETKPQKLPVVLPQDIHRQKDDGKEIVVTVTSFMQVRTKTAGIISRRGNSWALQEPADCSAVAFDVSAVEDGEGKKKLICSPIFRPVETRQVSEVVNGRECHRIEAVLPAPAPGILRIMPGDFIVPDSKYDNGMYAASFDKAENRFENTINGNKTRMVITHLNRLSVVDQDSGLEISYIEVPQAEAPRKNMGIRKKAKNEKSDIDNAVQAVD